MYRMTWTIITKIQEYIQKKNNNNDIHKLWLNPTPQHFYSWKHRQQTPRTAWNQSYCVIWCVRMCVCLVSLDLGSFRITEGVQREGKLRQRSSEIKEKRTKTCWPLLSAPPTYLREMVMLPGAFLLNVMIISLYSAKCKAPKREKKPWKDAEVRQDVWIAIF